MGLNGCGIGCDRNFSLQWDKNRGSRQVSSSKLCGIYLEIRGRTQNNQQKQNERKKTSVSTCPVVLNPKKHQYALIFHQVLLELLLYCYFALSLIMSSKRKLLFPSSECSLELTNVAFNHIKWKEVTEIFVDNPDSLSISGYM